MSPDELERFQRGEKAWDAWGFYLLRRERVDPVAGPRQRWRIGHAAFDVPHFVMEQK